MKHDYSGIVVFAGPIALGVALLLTYWAITGVRPW